jgi:hypothetical protein
MVPFKFLLLLGNALGTPPPPPTRLSDIDENIDVMFLLSNTTLHIQPMDQGTTAIFKSCYVWKTFDHPVKDIDGEDQFSVEDFWTNFNIKRRLTTLEMHGQKCAVLHEWALEKIWSDVVTDFHSFEPEEKISSSKSAIIDMARTVGSEDADEANVDELCQSHTEQLTSKELLELKKELSDQDDESSRMTPNEHLTTKQQVEFFKHYDIAIGLTDENYATERERGAKVARSNECALACYKELYKVRHKAPQHLSLHHLSKRLESCQSTDSEPSPSASSQPSLILLHCHQYHLSYLIKLHSIAYQILFF